MFYVTRRLAVVVSAGLLIPVTSAAGKAVTRQHVRQYSQAYHAVARIDGSRAPGRNIVRWGMNSHRKATDAQVVASLEVLHRMLAPPPAPVSTATSSAPAPASTSSSSASYSSGGGYSDVPGVPSGFAACVATRESSNGAGSSNIYGIIPASGSNAGSGSLAEQKAAFAQLYAQYGTAPWQPYDGC